ncbi:MULTISPECIES: anti-sigma factor family protein [unclassified Sphingopyxis]|jgi:anti-sigma factor RsiW|uniref:anti-sigma factor family protein n=1 Tax=unclassified Sphingopyxis TaxID=2614943 RepID=UPI0025EA4C94|nr:MULTISPECIES: anti-sigma factor [unclassified Sphingopyxis]
MSFDPDTIAAFVDGELDDLTARRIEREAESDAALAAEIARYRALTAKLSAHFAPVVDEAVPERLRALLVEGGIDISMADRRNAKHRLFAPVHWGAIAASLVFGLTIGLRPWVPAADIASVNGTLVASGALADALDTQLASDQLANAEIRIGLSFRDRQGRVCRSFEARDVSGIGCRDSGRWALERAIGGRANPEYRQASSGELLAAAAVMMAGDPFDFAAERAARDKGWRN